MLKVVLDTNCFISCIGKRSDFRGVFDAFLNKQFQLCVSTEILLEYEEMFGQFWGEEVTHNLLATILTADNVSLDTVFYNFNLVDGDMDDNKFADAYLAAGADFLVSNDAKLLNLNRNIYPKITVLDLSTFLAIAKGLS